MKNKILMCAMLVYVSAFAMPAGTRSAVTGPVYGKAKHHDNAAISYFAKEHFFMDFPNATDVAWKNTKAFQEAHFTMNNIAYTAYYDADNELVGTTTAKTFTDLPMNAQRYIQKKYAGYTPADVIFFDDNQANETDMNLFDQPFADEDNYFVLMKKPGENIVLKVNSEGYVDFFKNI
jgi:hypothetical protein